MCLQSDLKLEIMGENLIGGEPDPKYHTPKLSSNRAMKE
jgi:hypothetical protein